MGREVVIPGVQDPENPRKVIVTWTENDPLFGKRTAHRVTLTNEGGCRWYTVNVRPNSLTAPTPEQVAQANSDFDAVIRPWLLEGTVPTQEDNTE